MGSVDRSSVLVQDYHIGFAIFDGRQAQVSVSGIEAKSARIRAFDTMLPDRFRLVVAAEAIDAACLVTGRRGNLYTVLFA